MMILAVRADGEGLSGMRDGFHAMPAPEVWKSLQTAGVWVGPKEQLEVHSQFRQLITYIVVRRGSHYLSYTRGRGGSETRLHDQCSIGWGGHVDIPDLVLTDDGVDLQKTINKGADRELREELSLHNFARRRWSGLVVDSSTEVGCHHIGIVGIWDINDDATYKPNGEISSVAEMQLHQLENQQACLEVWSRSLLPFLKASSEWVAGAGNRSMLWS